MTYPYTPAKPPLPRSVEELRASIPGWGADLDPADRPAVPQMNLEAGQTGWHADVVAQQPEKRPRERSIEHPQLPPAFGTAQPLHGVSGAIRRLAYERYSEARAAHWLILVAGDRVDVLGSTLRSFASTRPDNLVTETGIKAELTHHGVRSRRGQGRSDLKHQWLDPVIVAGPWVLGGAAATGVALRLGTRIRRALTSD